MQRGYAQIRRIHSEAPDRLGHADAFLIGSPECVGIEVSNHSQAAEKRFAKAHTLLFRKPDDLDGKRKDAFAANLFDKSERDHHAKNAIERACIYDRVTMGTDD